MLHQISLYFYVKCHIHETKLKKNCSLYMYYIRVFTLSISQIIHWSFVNLPRKTFCLSDKLNFFVFYFSVETVFSSPELKVFLMTLCLSLCLCICKFLIFFWTSGLIWTNENFAQSILGLRELKVVKMKGQTFHE